MLTFTEWPGNLIFHIKKGEMETAVHQIIAEPSRCKLLINKTSQMKRREQSRAKYPNKSLSRVIRSVPTRALCRRELLCFQPPANRSLNRKRKSGPNSYQRKMM